MLPCSETTGTELPTVPRNPCHDQIHAPVCFKAQEVPSQVSPRLLRTSDLYTAEKGRWGYDTGTYPGNLSSRPCPSLRLDSIIDLDSSEVRFSELSGQWLRPALQVSIPHPTKWDVPQGRLPMKRLGAPSSTYLSQHYDQGAHGTNNSISSAFCCAQTLYCDRTGTHGVTLSWFQSSSWIHLVYLSMRSSVRSIYPSLSGKKMQYTCKHFSALWLPRNHSALSINDVND
ncbi:hypothetical protein B0T13DRAFT_245843 [Neurospora crassa]|nr:hypothetical protein B0T13DRAFT_245843 [Neurospora crassa]